MKKYKCLGIAGLSLAVLSSFAIAGSARAQQTSQLRVQPALIQERVDPGQVINDHLTITNLDSVVHDYSLSTADIKGLTDIGEPIFATGTVPEYGVSTWIALGAKSVSVPAGGAKDVSFTIRVPQNAPPGGHYGGIFVAFGGTKPQQGSAVGYQVGTLVDLRISGEAIESAAIHEFSTDKSLYQGPKVTFTAKVSNQGNVLLRPRGPIDIVNMFGKKVATVVMNDANAAIFPGEERAFTATWSDSGLAVGRYDAVMSLAYGEDTRKTVSATASFWIIPVVPILLVLLGVIFFIVIFVWSLKLYVKKKVEKLSGGTVTKVSADGEGLLGPARLPFSRLLFVTILTLVFTLVFLIALFILFG